MAGGQDQQIGSSPLQLQLSTSLDQTPLSPTFSLRQSSRFNSPVASSPVVRSSLDGFNKMPLAEVKEEKESGDARDQCEFKIFCLSITCFFLRHLLTQSITFYGS